MIEKRLFWPRFAGVLLLVSMLPACAASPAPSADQAQVQAAVVGTLTAISLPAPAAAPTAGAGTSSTRTPAETATSAPTQSPSPVPSPPPTLTKTPGRLIITSTDGRIDFALVKTDRAKEWSNETALLTKPSSFPKKEGHDFVVVDVAVASVRDGHIQGRRGSIVVGSDGVQYPEVAWTWTGVNYSDPKDLHARSELVEGARGKLVFQVPSNVRPAQVRLAYLFFKSWSGPEEDRHIDIELQ